jgi:hypothetical protein
MTKILVRYKIGTSLKCGVCIHTKATFLYPVSVVLSSSKSAHPVTGGLLAVDCLDCSERAPYPALSSDAACRPIDVADSMWFLAVDGEAGPYLSIADPYLS